MNESRACLQESNRTDVEGKGIRNVNNLVLCDLLHNVIHLNIHRNALKMMCTCANAPCTAPHECGGEGTKTITPVGTVGRFPCQSPHAGLGQCPAVVRLGQQAEIGMPFKSSSQKEMLRSGTARTSSER